MSKPKLTTETFIERAVAKHGHKYDYSMVEYCGSNLFVNVICKQHGMFSQKAAGHLHGYGCNKCGIDAMKKKVSHSTELFIKKANIKHNNKYDYNAVIYSNTHTVVTITCPIHGEFTQIPNDHLNGSGCKLCYYQHQQTPGYDTNTYLTYASEIHGNKYCYSNTTYNGAHNLVTVDCLEHGEFSLLAYSHLAGIGCSKCAGNHVSNTSEFIKKASQIHNNCYEYNKVLYVNSSTKVNITCIKHGDWNQSPSNHLLGHGCPNCANVGVYNYNALVSNSELGSSDAYVYLLELQNDTERFHKIGITTNITTRMRGMSSTYNKRMLATTQLSLLNAYCLEQNILHLHHTYRPLIKFGGHTECLMLDDADISDIVNILNTIDADSSIQLMVMV